MSSARKPPDDGKSKGTASTRGKVHILALDQIQDDTELQPRTHMDMDVMREYTNVWLDIEAGNAVEEFPPRRLLL